MPSIIEGYNYDIFISYRQKDNKGDKWVSKFVEALKTELEATFKEDVSVYFDENPHDRLQETHNVDKSLEGKLKCLIFLPILSQTYCDPNSYAWQYEFLAFLRMAENDRFGKDVKLRSGNVASRILPIRIHDLEPEDIKLFEKKTGSVLRALDFVFKTSTGVNRTLKANEDHPNDNLNKTFYSDQINKVVLAIKEIILGMKTEPVLAVKEKDQVSEPSKGVREDERKIDLEKPAKAGKLKLITAVAVVAILIIAAILAYPKIFKRDTLEKLRSSSERIAVAVMPFQNMTNDTTWNVWQNGIQDILVTYLSNFPDELKVRQTESINNLIQSKGLTNNASVTSSVASNISQKLDANVFIYGSIKRAGTTLRLNTQLIDSKTEEAFKSFEINGPAREEMIFQFVDSLKKMIKNFLVISKLEKEVSPDFKNLASTNSPEAYRYFNSGNIAFSKRDFPTAVKLLEQAIVIDTNFIYAILIIPFAYGNQGLYEEAKKWCIRAYGKKDQMTMQQKVWVNRIYANYFETPSEDIKYLRQLLEFDDQMPWVYFNIGNDYNDLQQYDKAIIEFEKSLEIYKKWYSKPMWVWNYTSLGYAYHQLRQYKKETELYKKAEQDFPDDPDMIFRQSILSLSEGDTVMANQNIEKYISVSKENSRSEADITKILADIYYEAGIMNKAEKYYRKALSLEPDNPDRLNTLAWFLINNDRNINEGLELVDKAMNLRPNYYNYLDTKGWGLYKQGKNKEALEFLEKAWNLKPVYDHEVYLHLEAAKKAVGSQKNN
jgi:tetratricopeptide (TPR) repeat protein